MDCHQFSVKAPSLRHHSSTLGTTSTLSTVCLYKSYSGTPVFDPDRHLLTMSSEAYGGAGVNRRGELGGGEEGLGLGGGWGGGGHVWTWGREPSVHYNYYLQSRFTCIFKGSTLTMSFETFFVVGRYVCVCVGGGGGGGLDGQGLDFQLITVITITISNQNPHAYLKALHWAIFNEEGRGRSPDWKQGVNSKFDKQKRRDHLESFLSSLYLTLPSSHFWSQLPWWPHLMNIHC